jgi:NADH-quinone oxidoreductase subunit C
MNPDEAAAALVTALGEGSDGGVVVVGRTGADRWARATVDVAPDRWRAALLVARDALGCDFFDWLSAVDELEQGYAVVAHVWSTPHRFGVLIRTRVPRERPVIDSVVDVYPGASWHERETHEMFGMTVVGHPGLAPLLLSPRFDGHPLRKDFVLASRVAKPWPGAVEPGEPAESTPAAEAGGPGAGRRTPARAAARPPGVPDPAEWGPAAGRSR